MGLIQSKWMQSREAWIKSSVTLLVLVPTILGSTACGSTKGDARIVSLELLSNSENQKSLQHTEESQGVFSATVNLENQLVEYHTTRMKECDLPTARTHQSTTRQLLVGFEGLKIDPTETISIENTKLTRTFAKAQLDSENLQLIIYSFTTADCVEDYVVWFNSSASSNPKRAVAKRYEQYLASVFQDTASPKVPSSSLALDKKLNLASLPADSN
jgi:hypothetical protein